MPNELWVESPQLYFKHDQECQFKEMLELDRHMVLLPVNLPQDVTFDNDAKIGSGTIKYRLTRWALLQLCKITCPSMYGFVIDLAGMNRDDNSRREDYSFSEALEIFNRVIRRRFYTRLHGKVALVDMARKTIDGFVTSAYQWLPNCELYARMKAAIEQTTDSVFLEASMVGRRMLLRYMEKKPCFGFETEDGIEERFFSGYHFSNDEVGQASVRAANVLYRKFSKSASVIIVGDRSGFVNHVGPKFKSRFDQLIQGLLSHKYEPAKCMASIRKLRETQLGLGSKNVNTEKKRMEEISSTLVRKCIPSDIARSVVANTAYQGSYDESPIESILHRPKERTVYDLYNAMGRCAVSLPVHTRELVERIAHTVFLGKVAFD